MGFANIISTSALVLCFSLAQRTLAQNASRSDSIAPLSPCMADRPTTTPNEDQGTVIMRVQVSKSRVIHNMEVFSGPPALTKTAIKAVKRWKYRPVPWVTGPPSDQYAFLSVTLIRGAPPRIEEIDYGGPGGDLGCVTATTPIRVSKGVMEKRLLNRTEPVYPPEAQAQNINGVVVLRITIDNGGNISEADKMSGLPVLISAAIDAVKQW